MIALANNQYFEEYELKQLLGLSEEKEIRWRNALSDFDI